MTLPIRILAASLVLLAVSGCQSNKAISQAESVKHVAAEVAPELDKSLISYHVVLPEAEVPFKGELIGRDPAQGQAMLYPNLAALFVHAAIESGKQSAAATAAQEEADLVLMPFKSQISEVTGAFLLDGLAQQEWSGHGHDILVAAASDSALSAEADTGSDKLLVSVYPGYFMARDQSGLSLDAAVFISIPGSETEANLYQRRIRVITDERAHKQGWVDENGQGQLGAQATELLKQAVLLAVRDFADDSLSWDSHPESTIRYRMGKEKRVERGRVIASHCSGLIFEGLDTSLNFVPKHRRPDSCDVTLKPVMDQSELAWPAQVAISR